MKGERSWIPLLRPTRLIIKGGICPFSFDQTKGCKITRLFIKHPLPTPPEGFEAILPTILRMVAAIGLEISRVGLEPVPYHLQVEKTILAMPLPVSRSLPGRKTGECPTGFLPGPHIRSRDIPTAAIQTPLLPFSHRRPLPGTTTKLPLLKIFSEKPQERKTGGNLKPLLGGTSLTGGDILEGTLPPTLVPEDLECNPDDPRWEQDAQYELAGR